MNNDIFEVREMPKGFGLFLHHLRFFWFFWVPPTVFTGWVGWILHKESAGVMPFDAGAWLVLLMAWVLSFTVCFGIRFGLGK